MSTSGGQPSEPFLSPATRCHGLYIPMWWQMCLLAAVMEQNPKEGMEQPHRTGDAQSGACCDPPDPKCKQAGDTELTTPHPLTCFYF